PPPGNPASRRRIHCFSLFCLIDVYFSSNSLGKHHPSFFPFFPYTPLSLSDEDIRLNFARCYTPRRYVGCVTERNKGGLAIFRHGKPERRDIRLAHARRQEPNLKG